MRHTNPAAAPGAPASSIHSLARASPVADGIPAASTRNGPISVTAAAARWRRNWSAWPVRVSRVRSLGRDQPFGRVRERIHLCSGRFGPPADVPGAEQELLHLEI